MNGKPKNRSALSKSVMLADIGQMPSQRRKGKQVDKAILFCLSQYCNEFGKGARPGNKALEAAAGIGWSQVHIHLEALIAAKMIERTEVGNGWGNASVYSILYNHPVFPDHSPNMREWFVIGGPEDSPNHPVSDSPNHPVTESEKSKPSGYEGEKADNHPVTEDNHPVTEKNHPVFIPGAHLNPIQPPTKPSIQTPAPESGADGWREFLENLRPCPDMEKAPMNRKVESKLRGLVVQHGGKVMARTAWWWFKYRPQGTGGMKMSPWFFFVKEYEPYLREAIDHIPGPDGKTPAQKREDEQQEAAAALIRKYAATEQLEQEKSDEESVEETLRMLRDAK